MKRFDVDNLKLWQKGLILVIVPIVFELVFLGSLVYLLRQAEQQAWLENRVKTVVVGCHELTKLFYDAGAGVILFGMTHNSSFLGQYDKHMSEIPEELTSIKDSVADLNPTDKSFEKVENSAYKGLATLRSLRAKADLGEARMFSKDIRVVMQQFIDDISEFVDHFKQLQVEAPEKSARSRQLVIYCLCGGVVANIALGIALAIFFNLGTSKRLSVLMDNTRRLAKRQSLNPPIRGTDELANLDSIFRKMADELDVAAKRKQELVSMVSHDLRTPLMSIQVSLELLSAGAMGELPEQARNELQVAEYSATRLIGLINDLLDIDRLESGTFDILPRHFDLGWIFERCVRSVHAYAERHKVKVVVPEDEDVRVFADADRLAQVLTNLLSNAIKFAPIESEVVLSYDEMDDSTVIRVTDHGRGIPKGFEQKIFERFQQVDKHSELEKKGTGLGLAICKAIIEAHHGTIGVDSTEGEGSTFWFRIPKEKQHLALAAAKPAKQN